MALSCGLARLKEACTLHDICVLAASGPDARDDAAAAALLRCLLGGDSRGCPELMVLLTKHALMLHCTAAAWQEGLEATVKTLAHGTGIKVEAFVLPAGQTADQAHGFKIEAARVMLKRAATDGAVQLAGGASLEAAATDWPILRAAMHMDESPPAASPAAAAAAGLLGHAARSVDAAAVGEGGWVKCGVEAAVAGWAGLLGRLEKAGDAYERGEITELQLAAAATKSARKAAGLPEAEGAPAVAGQTPMAADECGVWAGAHSAKWAEDVPRKRQLRTLGDGGGRALHLVARLSGGAVRCARTVFLSNGAVPHHWQHRVFSDGSVFDPIVEDEVPEVDRAADVLRLMVLYGALARAVSDVAAAVAAACPAHLDNARAAAALHSSLASANLSEHLPEGFDVSGGHSSLGHSVAGTQDGGRFRRSPRTPTSPSSGGFAPPPPPPLPSRARQRWPRWRSRPRPTGSCTWSRRGWRPPPRAPSSSRRAMCSTGGATPRRSRRCRC